MQDDCLGNEFKPDGEKLCNVFFDDTHIGDHFAEDHFANLIRVLTLARKSNIQYRLIKCLFFQPSVLLIGFICGADGRRPDPKKIEQLRNWPEYNSCEAIHSHYAFCNYLQEFYGPEFVQKTKPVTQYMKRVPILVAITKTKRPKQHVHG